MTQDAFSVRIGIAGFDSRETALLKFFLKRNLPPGYILSDETPDAHIIGMSLLCQSNRELWADRTRNGASRSIVISSDTIKLPNTIWLKKPFNRNDLLGLIDRTFSKARLARTAGDSQKLPPETEQHLATPNDPKGTVRWYYGFGDHVYERVFRQETQEFSLFYRPEQFIEGQLTWLFKKYKSHKSSSAIRLETSICNMVLNPTDGLIFFENIDLYVKRLGHYPAKFIGAKTRPLRSDSIDWSRRDDPRIHTADDVIARLSMATSRGRVPAGTSLTQPVSLKEWPNLTRMPYPPDSMRLNSLWHVQPTSLMETAKVLSLPYHVVFSCYSALRAMDIIDTDHAKRARPVQPAKSPLPSRLVNSLWQRLRKLSGSTMVAW